MYQFLVRNFSGSEIYDIPFETINIKEELNKGVSGSININYLALKRYATKLGTTVDAILSNVYREWLLYKDTTLLFGGVFVSRALTGSKSQGSVLTINLIGYEGLLSNRVTGEKDEFSSEDSSDIAWSLISTTQAKTNGNLGITRGLDPTTVDRDRTYRYEYIRKAIEKMSNESVYNGYDWEITAQKVFNLYYPTKGSEKANIILDDFNIISWQDSRQLIGSLANKVYALGEGQEDAMLVASKEDTTSQSSFYLQEYVLNEKSIKTTDTLEDKAQEYLNAHKDVSKIINVVVNDTNPDVTSYNLGDSLKVRIDEIDFDDFLRVKSRNFQIQRTGNAIINLTFYYD